MIRGQRGSVVGELCIFLVLLYILSAVLGKPIPQNGGLKAVVDRIWNGRTVVEDAN